MGFPYFSNNNNAAGISSAVIDASPSSEDQAVQVSENFINQTGSNFINQTGSILEVPYFSYDLISPEDNKIFDNNDLQLDTTTGIPKNYVKIVCKVSSNFFNPTTPNNVNFQIVLTKNKKETIINIEKDIVIFDLKNMMTSPTLSFEKTLDDYQDGVYEFYIIANTTSGKFLSKKQQFIIDASIQDTGNILVTKLEDEFGIPPRYQLFLESFLYKNSKNKVLFIINKYLPFTTISVDESFSIKQDLSFKVYRTTQQPKNIKDIANENNIYRVFLDSQKNQFAYDDFLEPGITYYYIIKAERIKNPDFLDTIEDDFSEIYKITLLKDSEFYYLEKSIFNLLDAIEKKQETSFMNKIFVDSVFNIDSVNDFYKKSKEYSKFENFLFAGSNVNSFNSSNNFPYIKFRITSKKTNRKIDLNLNYIFQQNWYYNYDKGKAYLQNKNVENVKVIYKLENPSPSLLTKYKEQLAFLENMVIVYNEIHKQKVKFIRNGNSEIIIENVKQKDFAIIYKLSLDFIQLNTQESFLADYLFIINLFDLQFVY